MRGTPTCTRTAALVANGATGANAAAVARADNREMIRLILFARSDLFRSDGSSQHREATVFG
jgi:hypothetical protein